MRQSFWRCFIIFVATLLIWGCAGSQPVQTLNMSSSQKSESTTAGDDTEATIEPTSSERPAQGPLAEAIQLHRDAIEGEIDAFVKADDALKGVLAKEPENVEALCYLANNRIEHAKAEGQRGRVDLALIGIKQVLATHPNEPCLHLAKAMAHWEIGEQTDAFSAVEKSIALSRQYYEANLFYGRINLSIQNTVAAKDALNQAIAIKPNSYWPYYYMGLACNMEGKYREAYPWFRDAEKNDPKQFAHLVALSHAVLNRQGADWCDGKTVEVALQLLKQYITRTKESRTLFESQMVDIAENRTKSLHHFMRYVHCGLRDAEKAMAEMKRLQEEQEEREKEMAELAKQAEEIVRIELEGKLGGASDKVDEAAIEGELRTEEAERETEERKRSEEK